MTTDDRTVEVIDCPRARSWATPCIARDGSAALADDHRCVGCNAAPGPLVTDLLARMPGTTVVRSRNRATQADHLRALVAAYVADHQVTEPTWLRQDPDGFRIVDRD